MKCMNKFLFADPSKGKQLPSREAVISGIRSIGHKSIISKTQATDIAWADVTWNPIWGCTQISEGCDNCYAKKLAHGRGYGGPSGLRPYLWGKDGETETGPTWDVERGRSITRPSGWAKLDALNRKAEKNNQVIVCFGNSQTDVFQDHPVAKREMQRYWQKIKETPWIHYMLLTKRANNIRKSLPADWHDYEHGYPNVWLGVSIELQKYAYRWENHLVDVPAVNKFVSYEPALGPLRLKHLHKLDLVIVGGESGANRRPFEYNWARDMHQDCRKYGVCFFYKQDAGFRQSTNPYLDGKEWREMPIPRESYLKKSTANLDEGDDTSQAA